MKKARQRGGMPVKSSPSRQKTLKLAFLLSLLLLLFHYSQYRDIQCNYRLLLSIHASC